MFIILILNLYLCPKILSHNWLAILSNLRMCLKFFCGVNFYILIYNYELKVSIIDATELKTWANKYQYSIDSTRN